MKTVKIHGKDYVEVNERIKHFRCKYPDGQIITTLLSGGSEKCIIKAEIIINDKVVSSGHAYEIEGSGHINKTSYIENCETSAIGRALGIFGIGIDASVASADEVENAIEIQKKTKMPVDEIIKKLESAPKDKINSMIEYWNSTKSNYTTAEVNKVDTFIWGFLK